MSELPDLVIDRVENGIIVIDAEYKIILWNKWLESYSCINSKDVIGKSIIDVIPLFTKPYYQHIFKNALLEHQSMFCSGAIHSVFVKKQNQSSNGETRQNMRIEPILFEDNTYILLQINDISTQHKQVSMLKNEIAERKKVEKVIRDSEEEMKCLKDEALQASKTKSEFLAVMSHEIRTPMNAIIGMAELLQETVLSEEQSKYVTIFQKSGENLLRIINDILDISKIEAGKMEFLKKEIDLPQLLEEVVATYSFQAEKKGLVFEYSPEILSTCVSSDPTRLHQIISNVVSNAIKFTEEGSVRLEAHLTDLGAEKIQLQCNVIDTGIGIPEEKRDSIFEQFTQVDSSTTRRFGGTGLGLAIVKRLTEEMNGNITVTDNGDGKGSSFFIKVELDKCKEKVCKNTHEKRRDQPVPVPRTVTNVGDKVYKILIAEDSSDNYKLLQAYLKNELMTIDIVENGKDAILFFKQKKYDLIIMDIEMPEMDGIEATKVIRAWEQKNKLKPIPIVALTAHALGGYEIKTIKAGCNYHLVKPIKKQTLITALYKALNVETLFSNKKTQ